MMNIQTILFALSILTTIICIDSITASDPAADSFNREQDSTRAALVERIIGVSENTIANPAFLETDEWTNFVKVLRSEEWDGLTDDEFLREFNRMRFKADLPFTHYRLEKIREEDTGSENTALIEITEHDSKTVILNVRINFDMDEEDMISAIRRIHSGYYENLIIDIRGNQGGSFPSVVILGRYLTNQMMDTGVYLTRKWFAVYGDYPTQEQLNKIPVLQDFSLGGFTNLLQTKGAARMILPPHSDPVFGGDVYLLTDGNTASASEPFVHLIKESGAATIIGEQTAGAMLSGERIPIYDTFTLFVPVADYMTADGHRIDKVGVSPDIAVSSEDALSKALEIIGK